VAFAEDVRISVTADPSELSEAGTVSFSFEISNNSVYELHDVTVTYMGAVYDIMKKYELAPIAVGRSVTGIVLQLPVTEAQLGQVLTFVVGWRQGGEPFTKEVQYTMVRAANPVISVIRTASAEVAKQGESITLTYELKNETKFDMTNIVLIDEDLSDYPILRLDALRANSATTTTHQYRMSTVDVVSAPIVTYTVNGKSKVFSAITPLTLTMALVQLDMSVDMGMPTAGGVTFTLEVKNTGNQTVRDIHIADERGTVVNNTPFSLATGDSVAYPFLVVPLMSEPLRNVSFTLNGTDPFDQPYTLKSDQSYEVYPFVDESQINVMMRAETVTPWTPETATVSARIILTNYSTVALSNIVISESTIGVVSSIDMLPAAETSFDIELLIGSPRNLQFSAKGNDPTGTTRELSTCLLPVAYQGDDGDVTATPEPQQNPDRAFSFLNSAISKVLVVLGVLMVLAFIVLIVLNLMERGRSLRLRFTEDGDESDETFDELFDVKSLNSVNDSQAADAAYFAQRIARAEEKEMIEQKDPPQPLPLPEPKAITDEVSIDLVDSTYQADQSETEALLNAEIAHILLAEDDTIVSEYTNKAQQEEPLPESLPIPKVITSRAKTVVQPAARGQIRYVQHEENSES